MKYTEILFRANNQISKDYFAPPRRLKVKIASWAIIAALIGLSMLWAWLMIGCDIAWALDSSGYIQFGVAPAFHDDYYVSYTYDGAKYNNQDAWPFEEGGKYELEIYEKIQIKDFAIELSPRLFLGAPWPNSTSSYSPEWGHLVASSTVSYYISQRVSLSYKHTFSWPLWNLCDQYQWSNINRGLAGIKYEW